jgi:uncharacterized membrane protein
MAMKNTEVAWLLGGIGLGTGLMYLLDPNQGRRRRSYLRDQTVRAGHAISECMDTTTRDVRNRAQGLAAEAGSRLRRDEAPDEVLVERVRSAMGRAVSHPHAIQVTAEGGRITLSGPVLAGEVDGLIAAVSRVRGVRAVENRLEVHQHPGNVPALQGGSTRPGRYGLARENWPPATRLLVGTAGSALAVYGAIRRDALGAGLGIAGLGMVARSATNLPVDRLTGVGAGRRAIEFQKAINIAAPIEEVYAFCITYENWPRFMSHVREVHGEGQQSHWVVDGPGGVPVSWDAMVTQFVPNEVLAWKSVEGSMIQQAGIMRFDRNPDGTTRVEIRMSYNPPAGAIGHAFATLLGANPERQMDEDFNRLKSLIEEGKTSAPDQGEVTRDQLAA